MTPERRLYITVLILVPLIFMAITLFAAWGGALLYTPPCSDGSHPVTDECVLNTN